MTAAAAATAGEVAIRSGRPRSRAADDAILTATLDLLREHGYGGLTVASVIERAGVSSATLYRRWTTKQDLVLAALENMRPEPANTDTGSLEGDIRAFLRHTCSAIDRGWAELSDAIGLEANRNPELSAALRERFLDPKVEVLRAIMERAKHRGELASTPSGEAALSLVVGPVHHHAIVMRRPLTDGFMRKATVSAVAGLKAACA
jgi:AcrR family transcriptional regulator